MNPHQLHNMWEVVQAWRADGLEFVRTSAPKILFIVILSFLLIRLLKALTNRMNKVNAAQELPGGVRTQQLRTLSSVIYSVGVFVILFGAAMEILDKLGIQMAPLLAGAGIAGLAVGFGAQTLVKDVINGFFILLENWYDIGDVVKIGAVQGTVEAITLRRTVLRDGDGSVHNIPNSEIKIVSNLTRDWTQVSIRVSVSYNENSDRVIALLQEIGAELKSDPVYGEQIVAEPEVPGIERVSPGEVEYLMLVKTRPNRQFPVQRELRRRIKQCFEKNGIQPGRAPLYVVESAGMPK